MQVNFQDYNTYLIRSSAILTAGSYVAGTILGPNELVESENQLILLVDFTLGNLGSAQIKVETSRDNITFYQETIADTTSNFGVSIEKVLEHSYEATGKYRIPIQIKDRYIKISAKGSGADATNSLMEIIAIVGTA